MNKDAPPAPYNRQSGESRQAFAAFAAYRNMGPSRSLVKVGRELGKSTTLMERWSSKWQWVVRAAAFDDVLDRRRRRDATGAVRRAWRRQAKVARLLQQRVAERLQMFSEEDVRRMSNAQLIRWLSVAIEVERDALGCEDPAPNQRRRDDTPDTNERQATTIVQQVVSSRAEVAEATRRAAENGLTPLK